MIVQRGYITSVGVGPKPKTSIDGTGKYLLPGLWDMHVHLWEQQPMFGLYVANGVLGVRDMGTDLTRTKEWRTGVEMARRIGPRIYTAGSPVDGPGADNAKMPVIYAGSPEIARRAVDSLDGQGADFIKVLSSLSRDSYMALAQRARVIRAEFAGHVPESVTVSQALDNRQKSMEHLFGVALACSSVEQELREERLLAIDAKDYDALARIRVRSYETFSESKATELFNRMARFNVWQTPTLTLRKRLSLIGVREAVENPLTQRAPSSVRAKWDDPRKDLEKATKEQIDRFQSDYEFHQKLVAMMQRKGVGLLAGTDTGDPYVLPGYALHDELELLVAAGLTPAEALRTATIHPARYFRIEARAGSIARGKRADLVLLDANPLEDIRNSRKISSVIVRGRLLDSKELNRLLSEADANWKDDSPFVEIPPDSRPLKRMSSTGKKNSRKR